MFYTLWTPVSPTLGSIPINPRSFYYQTWITNPKFEANTTSAMSADSASLSRPSQVSLQYKRTWEATFVSRIRGVCLVWTVRNFLSLGFYGLTRQLQGTPLLIPRHLINSTNLQSVFRLLGQFTPITRVIPSGECLSTFEVLSESVTGVIARVDYRQ
jgi:hypothetical protein